MVTDGSKPLRVWAAPPPRTLHVQKFSESRASELETLYSVVANRWNNDFRSQRNKRRRTTGYDNRASRNRIRKRHKVGVLDAIKDESLEKDIKKVPRHIRRRRELNENPQIGFCTSGDGTKRLRTHVWHAKRFTMTKRWGFHLAVGLPGRGKGSRALLKWLKNGVAVHDASYYSAVQLEGTEDLLLSILSTVMVPPPSAHTEELSHKVLSGVTYASSMLHHGGSPFFGIIAPVTYMWRPLHWGFKGADAECHGTDRNDDPGKINSCSSFRQLWVWIHAAAFREGLDALKAACQRQSKIDEPTASVACISLEGQLATLEVMGSKSFQLLRKILHPVTSMSENSPVFRRCSFAEADSETQLGNASILENEDQMFSSAIISLTVNDPRALTEKSVGVAPKATSTTIVDQIKGNEVKGHENLAGIAERNTELGSTPCLNPEEYSSLPDYMDLWDASKGLCRPLEESVLCMEKHHQRLTFFCLGDKSSGELDALTKRQFSRYCSVLLRRSNNLKESITRWSVILPLSWAKAFWVPLVSNGARAIGLREKRWVACEAGLPYFPSDFPECSAYSYFMATEAAAFDQNASLRPPSVRPLNIPIPPPWECVSCSFEKNSIRAGEAQSCTNELCAENMATDNSLTNSGYGDCDMEASHCVSFEGVVARTSSMLTHYLTAITGDHLLIFPSMPDKKACIYKIMKNEKMLSQRPDMASSLINRGKKLCFVRVFLNAYKEGIFEEGAVVCAPHLTDIKLWTCGSDSKNMELQVPQSSIASYFVQQPSGKWEFQVPEDPVAMESHRWPIGFVTTGFVRGSKKPLAGALCEAVLLASLREQQWNSVPLKRRRKEIYVLVRNLRSTAYRIALANIVLEQQEEDLEYM